MLSDIVRTYILQSNSGEVISCDDLHAQHPEHSVDEIFKFLHSPKVSAYLADRHRLLPPSRSKSRKTLSDRQRTWLAIITDPYSSNSLTGMIRQVNETGVYGAWTMDMATHRRWMKQPAFQAEYKRLLSTEIVSTEGEVIRRTATKAMAGDAKSAELLYRMQGKPLPNALAPGQGGGISIDVVMQVLQRLMTPDQLAQAAILFTNPDAPLELEVESSEGDWGDDDMPDISAPPYQGPQPGTEEI